MLKQEQIQLLEDYHASLLSTELQLEVEQTILADNVLGKEAADYLEILDGFKGLELEAFGLCLQSWEAKHKEETLVATAPTAVKEVKVVNLFTRYRFAIAAAIIVMLMPLGYYMIQGSVAAEVDLFATNFEPYKPLIDIKTRAPQPTNSADPAEAEKIARTMLLTEGVDAYNAKQYQQAIENLSQFILVATEDENLDEVRIYLGISYLIKNNADQAKQLFGEVLKDGKTGMYIDAAEWYIALTLLKEKDMQQAKRALKKIANAKKHRYKDNAAKLIPKLEQYK